MPNRFISELFTSFSRVNICFWSLSRSAGKVSRMWLVSCWLRTRCRYGVPILSAMCRYDGCDRKNLRSASNATFMSFLPSISLWDLLTTPIYPRLSGSNLFSKISLASVPSSIKSNLVMTPMVRRPSGSTSLANLRASLVAKSWLALVTARIRQLSRLMNVKIISRIWCSMSIGWSPTGTLVIPMAGHQKDWDQILAPIGS